MIANQELVSAEPIDADRSEPHLNLGRLNVCRNRLDAAEAQYRTAIALNSSGAFEEAMALLERTHREHPADRDVLLALTLVVRDHGDLAAALTHAQGLAGLGPPDPQVRAPIEDLRRRLRRYDLSLELARTVKATEIRPSVCRLPHLANPGSALLARNLRLLSGPGPCISPAGREGIYSPSRLC